MKFRNIIFFMFITVIFCNVMGVSVENKNIKNREPIFNIFVCLIKYCSNFNNSYEKFIIINVRNFYLYSNNRTKSSKP